MSTGIAPSERELGLLLAQSECGHIVTIVDFLPIEVSDLCRNRLWRAAATITEVLGQARADLRVFDDVVDRRRYG